MNRSFSIFILCLLFNRLFAKIDCSDTLTYEQSQIWIKETNLLDIEEKKREILSWIDCEQKIGLDSVKFRLTFIIEGRWVTEIPTYRNEIIQLVDAKNFELLKSICEMEGLYPERCNLGFLILKGFEHPVINNISGINVLKIKSKNGELRLIVRSNKTDEVNIVFENFIKKQTESDINRKTLKKGKNKIVYFVDDELKYIEIRSDNNKIVIIR